MEGTVFLHKVRQVIISELDIYKDIERKIFGWNNVWKESTFRAMCHVVTVSKETISGIQFAV